MSECDVAVVGGGPAGASCAAKLAALGFTVSLVEKKGEKGEGNRQHRGESLPSSINVLFERLSLSLPPEVIVERPPQHRVYWGELRGTSVVNHEHSFLVWRGPFDEHLRAHARTQGACLVDATVLSATRVASGFELSLDSSADESTLRCRILVDASGRAGVLARDYRQRERGFRTVALTAHFRTDEDDPPTLVESFPDGWAWSAPLLDGVRDITLMLDTNLELGVDYAEMLRRTTHVYRLVDGAEMVGTVRGIDATPYRASRYCDGGLVLVGDAASFLDPLAAHGVHKAMDSGLIAAVVARTTLEHPARAGDAAAFHDQRESDIYEVTTERLRGLYEQEARFRDLPFWRKRRLEESTVSAEPARPLPPLTPDMKLSPAIGVELVDAPVLNGELIERAQVLRAPHQERAVRFLGELSLPDIYMEATRAENAAAASRAARAPDDEAYRAIDWLYRSGYLVE